MTPPRLAPAAVLLAPLLGGCASELPPLPLRPEPVPYADTLPIPEPDEQDERRLFRALLVDAPYDLADPFDPPEGEALNRTHFDDVVGSAWWEPRMGYGPLSPERLARGPASPGGAPDESGPLLVKDGKREGVTPGFTLEDAKGDTYIVKFDPPHIPHLQSAPGVIVSKLMWGAGYWVPEDYILRFTADQLVVDEEAEIEIDGVERAMTQEDIQTILDQAAPLGDGRYLTLASKFVPGAPKGVFFFDGVRSDDPNDHYAHQHRRELRGLKVVSAWVHNYDIRVGNTLDVFVDPGYLRHYIIDFGATLGGASQRVKHPKDGAERPADLWRFLWRFGSLGFYEEGWEDDDPAIPDSAIGYIRTDRFQPGDWVPAWSNAAFQSMTAADGYWGAKIVASFTDDHIRAAVRTGGPLSERQVDTLTHILAVRRDLTTAYWFAEVTPIERPEIERQDRNGLVLSFDDLGIDPGPWRGRPTTYEWSFEHDARGLSAEGAGEGSTARPRQRITVGWGNRAPSGSLDGEDALATLEIRAVRRGVDEGRAATVHLRWNGASERYEVVGLEH